MGWPRLGAVVVCVTMVLLSLVTVPTAETTSRAASTTSPGRSSDMAADGDVEPPHSVQAVTRNPDGSTRVVEYTPGDGAAATDLYTGLRTAGVQGLVAPSAVAANGCSYAHVGTARTLCPILHWANNGYSNPQVYYADHTSGLWPVQSTTRNWNNSQGIDTHYVGSCPSGSHCVNVWSANYGNTCWQGISSWSYDGRGNFIDGSVSIWLNEYSGRGACGGRIINYYKTAAGYQQDACHEQGHTLGLDHNSSSDSCIYADIINSYNAVYPDAEDYELLNWIYATAH